MNIVQFPAVILKAKCEPLVVGSKQAREVADALSMALRSNKRKGIGISAPQLGYGVRCFVLDSHHLKMPKGISVFVNPELTWVSELEDVMEEGCLSFPDSVSISVRRPIRCTISAFSANGAQFTVELSGLAARCAQHEMDHLNSKTILDHATPGQKKKAMKKIVTALKMKVANKR